MITYTIKSPSGAIVWQASYNVLNPVRVALPDMDGKLFLPGIEHPILPPYTIEITVPEMP